MATLATRTGAVILAAGASRRMGTDKALLRLGDRTVVERVVDACHQAGADPIVVVRSHGAAVLPGSMSLVEVPAGGEMLHSVRAGLGALPDDCESAIVFPVDYAMVRAETARAVITKLREGAAVVLPLFEDRPGHPIGLSRSVFGEVREAPGTLRDVIVADDGRVKVVVVDDPWIRRDLDAPADLSAARAALGDRANGPTPD